MPFSNKRHFLYLYLCTMYHTPPVILFDGVCNFCNSSVNFVIKNDKKGQIKYAALQSFAGQQILDDYKFSNATLDTFVFIENGKLYTQSTAALRVCKQLTGLWPAMYVFIIVPRFIRDGVYNFIAKNRYKWFGKKDSCMIPTPDVRSRFLQ